MTEGAPEEEYRRRLAAHEARVADAARLVETISRVRAGVVGLTLLVAWLAFGLGWFSRWWVFAPVAMFVALLVVHAQVRRRRVDAERRVAFYRRGLARLDGQWAGAGQAGLRFIDPHHPYSVDLDLFGTGSLFELLCAARTSIGEETLAAWLLAPSAPEAVRARQEAVRALGPHLDLREDLAVLGDEVAAAVRLDSLVSLAAPAHPSAVRARIGAAAITGALLVLGAAWAVGLVPAIVPIVALAIQTAVSWQFASRVKEADRAVSGHGPDLALVAEVLGLLERAPVDSPLLARLRADLTSDGRSPSRAVRSLRTWVDLFDSRRNQFFVPIAMLTMWPVHTALGIEAWRARHGVSVEKWLGAVGQLEALCSLAGFAWEHPRDVHPEIVERGPVFEAVALGHPLIPEARCVRNDVALGGETRVLIVSGSNMSGKSTLLRSVGVNAVLALAGAPVRAARLVMSPVALGATLRVQDSLQEGTSRFYAELVRLRDLVQISAGPVPLLFLLDEILHGTNSHDRRLGAAGIVRGLIERGAIGLVTTHDLALSEVAGDPVLRAVNVHFEDRLEEGQMSFDYRMRPGVVRTSNALALMQTLGLWKPEDGRPS